MSGKIEHEGPGFALASYGLVNIAVWSQTPRVDHIKRTYALSLRLSRDNPGKKIISLSLVNTRSGVPDFETRKLSAEVIKKVTPFTAASVTVLEGQGFVVGAARAVVQSIHLLARTDYPQRVFASIEESAKFVAETCGYNAEQAQEISVLVSDARARLASAPCGSV